MDHQSPNLNTSSDFSFSGKIWSLRDVLNIDMDSAESSTSLCESAPYIGDSPHLWNCKIPFDQKD